MPWAFTFKSVQLINGIKYIMTLKQALLSRYRYRIVGERKSHGFPILIVHTSLQRDECPKIPCPMFTESQYQKQTIKARSLTRAVHSWVYLCAFHPARRLWVGMARLLDAHYARHRLLYSLHATRSIPFQHQINSP
jgi:hypothetical protein